MLHQVECSMYFTRTSSTVKSYIYIIDAGFAFEEQPYSRYRPAFTAITETSAAPLEHLAQFVRESRKVGGVVHLEGTNIHGLAPDGLTLGQPSCAAVPDVQLQDRQID